MYQFIKIWDLYHYFVAASKIVETGSIPQTEYPLGALIPMLLPRLLTSDYGMYAILFHIQSVLAFMFGLWLLRGMWPPVRRSLWAYVLPFAFLFPLAIELLDVYVAVLALLALWLFARGREVPAGIALVAAVSVKFYPIILFPYLMLRGTKRPLVMGIMAGLSVMVIALNMYGVSFHAARGVQPESVYGSAMYLIGSRKTEYAFNSIQFAGSSMPMWASALAMSFFALLAIRSRRFMEGAYLMVLGFILSFKVFSPQYLFWLAPFVPFVGARKRALFVAATVLTAWYLGFYDQAVVKLIAPYSFVLVVRNFLLALSFFL